jgi:predicted amidophosphoribosyltransferase
MNEAIKLAIEKGGYEIHNFRIGGEHIDRKEDEQIILDPLFWQALGKALGWEDSICETCKSKFPEYHNGCVRCGGHINPDPFMLYHALHYQELVLTGGDTEKFWKELIK